MSACSADPPFLSLLPPVHDPPYMHSIYLTTTFRLRATPRGFHNAIDLIHRMRGNIFCTELDISSFRDCLVVQRHPRPAIGRATREVEITRAV